MQTFREANAHAVGRPTWVPRALPLDPTKGRCVPGQARNAPASPQPNEWIPKAAAFGGGPGGKAPGGFQGGALTLPRSTRSPWTIDVSRLTPPRAKVTPRAHPTARLVGPPVAQVAELVDAQVSGTCGRKVVEV